MTRVIVCGALGKMGFTACGAVAAEDGLELTAAVDVAFNSESARNSFSHEGIPLFASISECLEHEEVDVAVDFTTPDAVFGNVMACLEKGVHSVVGTTGIKPSQLKEIEAKAGAGSANCLMAPNFAIGAVLMMMLSRQVARYMPACEIIELHHDQKLDAPSGTALRTAELIAEGRAADIEPPGPEGSSARGQKDGGTPIHSVRLPGLVAHQQVLFGGRGQTLSIRHDSISRESFMPGVILAVRRVGEIDGLAVGLEKVLQI